MKNVFDPTVFVVEDDDGVVSLIGTLLKSVGLKMKSFSNAQDYLKVHDPESCGCLLVDVRLPGISGLELLEKLNEQSNALPVVMMTGYGDISMAVRSMQKGAINFITKPFNSQVLLDEIQRACSISQKKLYNPSVEKYARLFNQLTPREQDVMRLVANGKLNKQIARELNIAISTVELYRSHVIKKMQVKNAIGLARVFSLIEKN
jgi:two-component system, LuxR family, response regulator FixJ